MFLECKKGGIEGGSESPRLFHLGSWGGPAGRRREGCRRGSVEPQEQGLVLPPPKEQGVIPLLGATHTELEKLDSVTKDHLEVGEPGGEAGVTRIEI